MVFYMYVGREGLLLVGLAWVVCVDAWLVEGVGG